MNSRAVFVVPPPPVKPTTLSTAGSALHDVDHLSAGGCSSPGTSCPGRPGSIRRGVRCPAAGKILSARGRTGRRSARSSPISTSSVSGAKRSATAERPAVGVDDRIERALAHLVEPAVPLVVLQQMRAHHRRGGQRDRHRDHDRRPPSSPRTRGTAGRRCRSSAAAG